MSPLRRISTGGIPTPSEEPEQAVSAELGELRALVTQLVARSFRQDQRLEQLLAQRSDPAVGERTRASKQHLERKRPAPDDNEQTSSRRRRQQARQLQAMVRCIFCRGQHNSDTCNLRFGRCYRCGQSGHIRATCPYVPSAAPPSASAPSSSQQQSRQLRVPGRCIFCGDHHFPSTCDQRWGRCYLCGQPGHLRVTCPSRITVVPTSASVSTTSQPRPGASPTDLQVDQVSFPHPSGERQLLSSSQDDLALAEDSTVADREKAGMIYFLA